MTQSPHPTPSGGESVQWKLVPCPFCGGRAAFFDGMIDFANYPGVYCTDCDVTIEPHEGESREEAAERWNTRAPTSPPQAGPYRFEPHNGYGGKDPDGEPWPFGYISTAHPSPVFELRPVLVQSREELLAIAEAMVAGLNAPPQEAVASGLRFFAQKVVDTFKESEAQGYHTRDRVYAIEMLEKGLHATPPSSRASVVEECASFVDNKFPTRPDIATAIRALAQGEDGR